MDAEKALEILKPLAEGIDPFTGEILPPESLYQNPEVIRALFAATTALQKQMERNRRQTNLPKNAGKPWSEEEDKELAELFDSGKSIEELSVLHQRTRGAIQSRLLKMGRLNLLGNDA